MSVRKISEASSIGIEFSNTDSWCSMSGRGRLVRVQFFSDPRNRDRTGVRAVIAAAGDLYLKVTCGGDYSMPRACVTDEFAARVGKHENDLPIYMCIILIW